MTLREERGSVHNTHTTNSKSDTNNYGWNTEIVVLLNKIRINSSFLSEKHRQRFFIYKQIGNYFDIPVIILSVLSSSFSVGSQEYLSQRTISLISCFISIFITIITSIKIYLNIDNILKNEIEISKNFYILSIDIYKILLLSPGDRTERPLEYLNKAYTMYQKLYEKSNLLKRRFRNDNLIELPNEFFSSEDAPETKNINFKKNESSKVINYNGSQVPFPSILPNLGQQHQQANSNNSTSNNSNINNNTRHTDPDIRSSLSSLGSPLNEKQKRIRDLNITIPNMMERNKSNSEAPLPLRLPDNEVISEPKTEQRNSFIMGSQNRNKSFKSIFDSSPALSSVLRTSHKSGDRQQSSSTDSDIEFGIDFENSL